MSGVRRSATVLCLVAAAFLHAPRSADAQAVPAAYGLIGGTIAGVYVTTGVFVTKARAGTFIYSLEDALAVRWELIPVVAMPIGSFVIGLDDGQRLANSIKWGGAGFAAGAAVGLGVGTLLEQSGGSESQWAGAIIGSAAGLLAGSIYGVFAYEEDDGGGSGSAAASFPALTVRIPF